MIIKTYRYVDGRILDKQENCDVARPWVIEINGSIHKNIIGHTLRYASAESAQAAIMTYLTELKNKTPQPN